MSRSLADALFRFTPVILMLAAGSGCSTPRPGAGGDAAPGCGLLLVNARIVDPAARQISAGAMLVRDGRIVSVTKEEPRVACARRLDLAGQWLLPGLVDLHVHAWGNPSPLPDDSTDQTVATEEVTRLVLKAGVTALLDLGGPEDERLQLRDKLRAERPGAPPHAAFFAAGPVFVETKAGRSERQRRKARGGPRLVSGPADARRQVRELAAKSPDVIKIIYDHDGDRSSMRRETMRAIVAESRALGLKTVVHIGTWRDAREAIEAGASAITHLYDDATIPAGLPALYARHHVFSIPTMAVQCDLDRILDPKSGVPFLQDPLLAAVTTPRLLAAYRDRAHYSGRARDWAEWQTEFCRAHDLPSLKALDAAGVVLGTGSDSGNLGVFEGFSVHRELELMVEAGVAPFTALAAATTGAGDFLRRRYGVRPGDEANLLAIAGDPVADINNTKRVTHVIVGGVLAF